MPSVFDLGYPATEYKSDRPGYRGTSLQSFYSRFPDGDACLRHVFRKRFGDTPPCVRCGKPGLWYPINGIRRLQHACGYAISPLAKTVFTSSSIPLQIWFYAMLHFANSTYGVPTTFLRRQLGLGQKATFRLADRIRLQMAALDRDKRIGQTGEPFEIRLEYLTGIRTRSYPTRGSARAVLLGDQNGVQTTLIGRARRHTLRAIIADKTAPGSVPVTTCKYTHSVLSEFGSRSPVAPLVSEFVNPQAGGTNSINNFLNYLRRPMQNTYRRVDYGNLWKYLKEFQFSFNRRLRSHETFGDLIGQFPSFTAESCADLEAWSSRSNFSLDVPR